MCVTSVSYSNWWCDGEVELHLYTCAWESVSGSRTLLHRNVIQLWRQHDAFCCVMWPSLPDVWLAGEQSKGKVWCCWVPGVVLNLVKAESRCYVRTLNDMSRRSWNVWRITVLSSAYASVTLYCNLNTQRWYQKLLQEPHLLKTVI